MSRTAALFRSMVQRGIALRIHCGALHYRDPKGALTFTERELLREQEEQVVLDTLRATDLAADLSNERAPLTFQQEFALERCGNSFYVVFAALLSGSLNAKALRRGVQRLVERHRALHSRIVVTDTGLWQETNGEARCDLALRDLQKSSASPGNSEVDACLGDLVREWLEAGESTFAVRLLRVSSREHVLLVLWDHLFTDHVSVGLLVEELWSFYRAAVGQHVTPVTSAPMQYSDFAIWQREGYASWYSRHGSYWQERLRGAVPIQIPADAGAQSASQGGHRAVVRFAFDEPVSASLSELARRSGVTLSAVVLTLAALTMSAWSGQRRFAVPMTVSGRYHLKHLQMIGYLPNFLPLRIELPNHETFAQLCSAVSKELLTGVARLDIAKTMDGGMPELLRAPFIQWFPSSPMPNEALVPATSAWDAQALELSIESYASPWQPPPGRGREFDFPMFLAFWEGQKGLLGLVCYRRSLYTAARIEQFAQDLLRMASCIGCEPDTPLASLLTASASD